MNSILTKVNNKIGKIEKLIREVEPKFAGFAESIFSHDHGVRVVLEDIGNKHSYIQAAILRELSEIGEVFVSRDELETTYDIKIKSL
jgi:hypothetical protein